MVRLIVGGKGAGKTKRIIEMANEQVENSSGNIVFIDYDKRHSIKINRDIRFINMGEFNINNKDNFFAFLCGILETDYDIEMIYVDGLVKIMGILRDEMIEYFGKLEELCKRYDVSFIITLTIEKEEVPELLQKSII